MIIVIDTRPTAAASNYTDVRDAFVEYRPAPLFWLPPLSEPAFDLPRARAPQREEVIRARLTRLKRRGPTRATRDEALRGLSEPRDNANERVNGNAGKSRGRAFELGPAQRTEVAMLYVVNLSGSGSHEIQVDTDSPENAVAFAIAARAQKVVSLAPDCVSQISEEPHPDDRKELAAWEFVGRCEACSSPILTPIPEPEGYVRTYSAEEDGIYVCKGCNDAG